MATTKRTLDVDTSALEEKLNAPAPSKGAPTAPKGPQIEEAVRLLREAADANANASNGNPRVQAATLDMQRFLAEVDAHAEKDETRKGKLFARAEHFATEHKAAREKYDALAKPPAPETSSAPVADVDGKSPR